MRKILQEKLIEENPIFTQEELDWLLAHIGDENPEIRDDLVFVSFARGIAKEYFTPTQFQYLSQVSMDKDLIFYQLKKSLPEVLTRTFSALLNSYLIEADGKKAGKYEHLLTAEQRKYFFARAVDYLAKEAVFTGYSEQYGWVHGFAHGADYLANAVAHPDFAESMALRALDVLAAVFYRLPESFSCGEERRLGEVVVSAILSGKLSQKQVADWLGQLDFPQNLQIERMRLANFEVFLAYIYFHLFEKIKLEDQLENELLKVLREI